MLTLQCINCMILCTYTHSADSLNHSSLDVIERAQFILCLDQGHPSTSSLPPHSLFSDIHSTVLANRCLHGGGSEFNSGNRWFDSGIQVCYCVHTQWYQIWSSLRCDVFMIVFSNSLHSVNSLHFWQSRTNMQKKIAIIIFISQQRHARFMATLPPI